VCRYADIMQVGRQEGRRTEEASQVPVLKRKKKEAEGWGRGAKAHLGLPYTAPNRVDNLPPLKSS
jgi:hypothetical protein